MLGLLERGDTVVVERRFDIENIPQGRTNLNIPPLLRTKTQFDEDEIKETRRIASLHVHVEQAMEQIKNSPITHYSLDSEGHSSHWDIH